MCTLPFAPFLHPPFSLHQLDSCLLVHETLVRWLGAIWMKMRRQKMPNSRQVPLTLSRAQHISPALASALSAFTVSGLLGDIQSVSVEIVNLIYWRPKYDQVPKSALHGHPNATLNINTFNCHNPLGLYQKAFVDFLAWQDVSLSDDNW